MADTESIGGISVSIGGDISPLVAAGAKATQVSAQIGSNVAGAFNTAAAGANQFANATEVLSVNLGATSAQAREASAAIEQLAKANSHSVSEIQATSGALRTLSGEGGIRAAERFLATTVSLGPALQSIFPIVGALALVEVFVRLGEHIAKFVTGWGDVSEAEKKAADEAAALDQEIAKIGKEIGDLDTRKFAEMFGAGAGKANELAQTTNQLSTQQLGGIRGEKGSSPEMAAQAVAVQLRKMQGLQESMQNGLKLSTQQQVGRFTELVPLEGIDRIHKALADVDAAADKAGNGMSSAFRKALKDLEPLRKELDAAEEMMSRTQAQAGLQGTQILTGSQGQSAEAKKQAAADDLQRLKSADEAAKNSADERRQAARAQIDSEHQVRQQAIDAIDDVGTRNIASADERVRVAKDTATRIGAIDRQETEDLIANLRARLAIEQQDKNLVQAGTLQRQTDTEIATSKSQLAQKSLTLLKDENDAESKAGDARVVAQRGWADEVTKAWLQSAEERQKQARETAAVEIGQSAYTFEAQQRVAQIQAKGQGRSDELRTERSLIALEAQYDEQSSHSARQQINYARQKTALEAQARQAKLTGLEADLKIAQAEAQAKAGTESGVEAAGKAAELEQQIAQLKQQNANADAKDALAVKELNDKLTEQLTIQKQITNAKNAAAATAQANQLSIGKELGKAIGNLPKNIGDDIGGAISDSLLSKHPGKSVGQEMAKELTDALKSTLGSILKQGLSSLFQIGLGFLGFAEGTDSAPGGIAMVGEKGPEIMHVPRGAQIIPNHKIKGYADGVGLGSARSDATTSSRSTVAFGDIHFHAHGISNPRQFAEMAVREIPGVLKARSPQFSPYSK